MNTKQAITASLAKGSPTIYNFLFDNNEAVDKQKDNTPIPDNTFPDYPSYSPVDDIYNKDKEEDLDPENPFETTRSTNKPGKRSDEKFKENETGDDLDVPGAELDDAQEEIGSEDEENNYYSLGGDDHEDLDEDKGI
jgi:hypothetical protein